MREAGLKCSLCPAQFPSHALLRRHNQAHFSSPKMRARNKKKQQQRQKSDKIQCPRCDFQAKCETSLNLHLKLHENPAEQFKPFECGMCNQRFTSKHTLRDHNKSFHEDVDDNIFEAILEKDKAEKGNYRKPEESESFESFESEKSIIKDVNLMHKHQECHLCDFSAEDNKSFRQHLRYHANPEEFRPTRCRICDKFLKSKIALKEHMYRMHENGVIDDTSKLMAIDDEEWVDNEGLADMEVNGKNDPISRPTKHPTHQPTKISKYKIQCPKCEFKAIDQKRLRLHMKFHENPDFKPFQCKSCGKQLKNKSGIKAHVCPIDKIFDEEAMKSFVDGDDDVIPTEPDKASPTNCGSCGEVFDSNKLFKKHICIDDIFEDISKTVRQHIANKSAANFMEENNIEDENNKINISILQCNRCKLAFETREALSVHRRYCTMQCSNCEFRTKSKKSLLQHKIKKGHHEKSKCPNCGFESRQSSLLLHIRECHKKTNSTQLLRSKQAVDVTDVGSTLSEKKTPKRKSKKIDWKNMQSDNCDYTAKNDEDLKKHLEVCSLIHDDSRGNLKCHECGMKGFSDQREVRNHRELEHSYWSAVEAEGERQELNKMKEKQRDEQEQAKLKAMRPGAGGLQARTEKERQEVTKPEVVILEELPLRGREERAKSDGVQNQDKLGQELGRQETLIIKNIQAEITKNLYEKRKQENMRLKQYQDQAELEVVQVEKEVMQVDQKLELQVREEVIQVGQERGQAEETLHLGKYQMIKQIIRNRELEKIEEEIQDRVQQRARQEQRREKVRPEQKVGEEISRQEWLEEMDRLKKFRREKVKQEQIEKVERIKQEKERGRPREKKENEKIKQEIERLEYRQKILQKEIEKKEKIRQERNKDPVRNKSVKNLEYDQNKEQIKPEEKLGKESEREKILQVQTSSIQASLANHLSGERGAHHHQYTTVYVLK